ncbi:MAG TPA: hypothetical protein VGM54_02320 [Chthoniobacter sp.]|jgi:hypothetical protein
MNSRRLLVAFICIVLLYALSIGPAALIHARLTPAHQRTFEEFADPIYWPLVWLYHASPPVGTVFNWYVRTWGGN